MQTLTNAFHRNSSPVCKIRITGALVFVLLHHSLNIICKAWTPCSSPQFKIMDNIPGASLSIIIYLCKSVIIRNSFAEASRYCNCYHKIFICFTSNIFISYTVLGRLTQQQICILLKALPRSPKGLASHTMKNRCTKR